MIGWTAKQVLSDLQRLSPSISTIALTSYVPEPILVDRLGPEPLSMVDALRFVREALRHRGYSNPVEDIAVGSLRDELERRPSKPGTVRGLCSRLRLTNGSGAQLPLLDFQCEVSEVNTTALKEAMKIMGQTRGALLASGRSYHYYGFEPVALGEWRGFMARCVLLAPLIDARYVAHCMIEELACLRLEPRPMQTFEPTVVATLE